LKPFPTLTVYVAAELNVIEFGSGVIFWRASRVEEPKILPNACEIDDRRQIPGRLDTEQSETFETDVDFWRQ
jgi:hypothetical protein